MLIIGLDRALIEFPGDGWLFVRVISNLSKSYSLPQSIGPASVTDRFPTPHQRGAITCKKLLEHFVEK